MGHKISFLSCLLISSTALTACLSTGSTTDRIAAPLPPLSDPSSLSYDRIETAGGVSPARHHNDQKCSMSSFHKDYMVGYQFSDQSQLNFKAMPSFDGDLDMNVGLRFTKTLGGESKKQPDCVYGAGYYGWLPYMANNDADFDLNMTGLSLDMSKFTDREFIRDYLQKRYDAKRASQMARDKDEVLGI